MLKRAASLGSTDPQHFVFPISYGGGYGAAYQPDKPMSPCGIRKPFEAVRAAAGLPWLRIHDLRHSAITRMAEAGVPIAVIMDIAGHVSARMSRHYTTISEQAKRRAIQNTARKVPKAATLTQPIVETPKRHHLAG